MTPDKKKTTSHSLKDSGMRESIERWFHSPATLEMVLIGYLYANFPDDSLLESISPEWFLAPQSQKAFNWMRDCRERGVPADWMRERAELGKDMCHFIVESQYIYANSGAFLDEIRMQYVADIRAAYNDREVAKLLAETGGRFTPDVRAKIVALTDDSDAAASATWVTPKDVMPSVLKNIQERLGKGPEMPTGYSVLDEMTDGLHRGELWTIGAYTSVGKTVCLTSMAHRLVSRGVRVLYFSSEMSHAEYLKERLLPVFADVDAMSVRKNELSPSDLERLQMGAEAMSSVQFFVVDKSTPSLLDIRRAVRLIKPRVVFIDYIHRCALPKAENRNLALGHFMTGLKTLAREHDIPIVAASQLNRQSQSDDDPPSLAHLRDSGSLEMESDVVLLLHRALEKLPGGVVQRSKTVNVLVAKNRHGMCGAFDLRLSTREMLLTEETAFEESMRTVPAMEPRAYRE